MVCRAVVNCGSHEWCDLSVHSAFRNWSAEATREPVLCKCRNLLAFARALLSDLRLVGVVMKANAIPGPKNCEDNVEQPNVHKLCCRSEPQVIGSPAETEPVRFGSSPQSQGNHEAEESNTKLYHTRNTRADQISRSSRWKIVSCKL